MKPKKSFGQNFLKNTKKIKDIVKHLSIKDGDTIIEIGTGHGEITREILKKNKSLHITTIEKDERLFSQLDFKKDKTNFIDTINGDALLLLPKIIKDLGLNSGQYKIIGNIPYYITGYLLRTIGKLENKPSLTILTLQKQVAERVCSKPPKTNLLSASIQIWADCKILELIPKSDFYPTPKVDSAVVSITTNSFLKNDPNYYEFIKILFKQPRKTILNNLKGLALPKEKILGLLSENGVSENDRPQNLDVKTIKNIYKIVYNIK